MGLLALGASSRWQIDIDEIINRDEYLMELNGPNLYFVFQLINLESVSRMAQYLREGVRRKKAGQNSTDDPEVLTIGHFDSNEVCLIWDHEESIRCYLALQPDANSAMQFMFDESDIGDLLVALDQVLRDLS